MMKSGLAKLIFRDSTTVLRVFDRLSWSKVKKDLFCGSFYYLLFK